MMVQSLRVEWLCLVTSLTLPSSPCSWMCLTHGWSKLFGRRMILTTFTSLACLRELVYTQTLNSGIYWSRVSGWSNGWRLKCDLVLYNLCPGQCFDDSTDHPTPGLEYVLGTASQPESFDTIVMANLGYFQLKAGPGAWSLRLRDGRSSEIYTIKS